MVALRAPLTPLLSLRERGYKIYVAIKFPKEILLPLRVSLLSRSEEGRAIKASIRGVTPLTPFAKRNRSWLPVAFGKGSQRRESKPIPPSSSHSEIRERSDWLRLREAKPVGAGKRSPLKGVRVERG